MGYVAWSVVYGEQPSAAKWNILGQNDASFNDGSGIANLGLDVTSLYNPYKFSAKPTSDQTGLTTATTYTVTFGTENFDTNNNFASNTYTAPINGYYQINAFCTVVATTTGNTWGLTLAVRKNATTNIMAYNFYDNNWSADFCAGCLSELVYLDAGNTLDVRVTGHASAGTWYIESNNTSFSGFLVSQT